MDEDAKEIELGEEDSSSSEDGSEYAYDSGSDPCSSPPPEEEEEEEDSPFRPDPRFERVEGLHLRAEVDPSGAFSAVLVRFFARLAGVGPCATEARHVLRACRTALRRTLDAASPDPAATVDDMWARERAEEAARRALLRARAVRARETVLREELEAAPGASDSKAVPLSVPDEAWAAPGLPRGAMRVRVVRAAHGLAPLDGTVSEACLEAAAAVLEGACDDELELEQPGLGGPDGDGHGPRCDAAPADFCDELERFLVALAARPGWDPAAATLSPEAVEDALEQCVVLGVRSAADELAEERGRLAARSAAAPAVPYGAPTDPHYDAWVPRVRFRRGAPLALAEVEAGMRGYLGLRVGRERVAMDFRLAGGDVFRMLDSDQSPASWLEPGRVFALVEGMLASGELEASPEQVAAFRESRARHGGLDDSAEARHRAAEAAAAEELLAQRGGAAPPAGRAGWGAGLPERLEQRHGRGRQRHASVPLAVSYAAAHVVHAEARRLGAPPMLAGLRKVLAQIHPSLRFASSGAAWIQRVASDVVVAVMFEAVVLTTMNRKRTVDSRAIQTAARLVLQGELAKHAVSEGTKAVTKLCTGDSDGLVIGTGPRRFAERMLKPTGLMFGSGARSYLSAVAEYICAEFIELGGNAATDASDGASGAADAIEAGHFVLAAKNDEELDRFLCRVVVSGVGAAAPDHQ